MTKEHTVALQCSFCGKAQREVRKLIAGPTVYICDECIKLCNEIIAKEAIQFDAAVLLVLREEPARGEKSHRRSVGLHL